MLESRACSLQPSRRSGPIARCSQDAVILSRSVRRSEMASNRAGRSLAEHHNRSAALDMIEIFQRFGAHRRAAKLAKTAALGDSR